MKKKHSFTRVAVCVAVSALLAVSVSAALDRVTGTVDGYFTEGLIYSGLDGGYCASTYVSPDADYSEVWAKVELVVSGEHPYKEKKGTRNSVDTDECTTTSYVASIRGYHYVETVGGDNWESKNTSKTGYLT